MDCPVCKSVKLAMSAREGIEIDYCPNCRGVWLDRGELDKLIDRAAEPPQNPSPASAATQYRSQPGNDDRHRYAGSEDRRRKKGFLGELFDFD